MKLYSKQDYSIAKAIRNTTEQGVMERGYLSPQFSTFSGITLNNLLNKFNICILDKDVVCDSDFQEAYRTYHTQCLALKLCSFLFYHPDNTPLAEFLNQQIISGANQFIASNDLSGKFVATWLSANYLQQRLPDMLNYYTNLPVLKVKELSCPLCGEIIKVPAGLFFASINIENFKRLVPIERFLPVTRFTDNIGGNVYNIQLQYGKFHLYDDETTDYSTPPFISCPDCAVRLPLNIHELRQDESDEIPTLIPMAPIRLTDEDIRTVRESDGCTEPGTGEWVKVK